MLGGSSFKFGASVGAGSAAGAVPGQVGEGTGEVFEGVTVLLELGVSVEISFGTVFALGRPRNDKKDRADEVGDLTFGSSAGLESSGFGCSTSLN